MKIIRAKDYAGMSRKAANIISAQIIMEPKCVLGLATGSTPIGIYEQLVAWYQKGDLDFSGVTSINLDEYKGLTKDNEQSYYYFMNKHLFDRVNMDKTRIFLPDGMQSDSDKACSDYDKVIRNVGGIDLLLLGLGHNGHIGFNEPGEEFVAQTHCVDLAQSTIQANQRFFASIEEVPRQAYTIGIQTIMQAKKVLVVVSGTEKAAIVKEAFFGKITPQVQASILQLHRDVIIVADEAALSAIYNGNREGGSQHDY
ncbi:MAG: glucosamine-6-phosphate deaminase [Roseburia sp.]|nr:glucosamine-6-phosphate deaminase [Roseburia sp.]MCM1243108.1 glucosamine-6-phosphate deaminase [Roseburia sp.]